MEPLKNPEAIAWIIAAEGSINILKSKANYYQPNITVYNTDREFIERFYELAGFRGYLTNLRYPRNPNHKPSSMWRVSDETGVKQFLSEILPYLPIKKAQAKAVIEFCVSRDPCWYEIVKMLNRRGV